MAAVGAGFGDEASEYLAASVLEPSETVRWTGRPSTRKAFFSGLWGTLAALLMLLAFAIVAHLVPVTFLKGDWLWIVLFLILCAWLAAKPVTGMAVVARTRFFITDRRVIVVRGLFGRRVISQFADDFYELRLRHNRHGHGSIYVLDEPLATGAGRNRPYGSAYRRLIWNTDDVQGAYDAILALKDTAAEPSP